MSSEPAPTNALEITVTELSGALRRSVEEQFGNVRVRGEVSSYRGPHSSGHVYFCLKDANARIDAVIWRSTFNRLRFKPQEGLEVIATGKVSTFPAKSTYQIVIEQLEPAGVGALMALLEERRRKLAAEGLFEQGRKRPTPYLPAVIGVVTSPSGAVIRDILHRLADRFPRRVLVWPVRVQGEGSAEEVAAAIRGFNALDVAGPTPRPDVLIVARGGGSLEDLWGFNEEIVVRAAAASAIPLISAIGHETDWTLLDLVADVRAPTPTGAAEMAVPVRADLLANLHNLAARRRSGLRRFLDALKTEWRSAARALPQGPALLAPPRQRLDLSAQNLSLYLARKMRNVELAVARLGARLHARSPQALIAARRAKFEAVGGQSAPALKRRLRDEARHVAIMADRLRRAMLARASIEGRRLHHDATRIASLGMRLRRAAATGQATRRARLTSLGQLLNSLSYRNVLERGYAVVMDVGGQPVTRAAAVAPGAPLELQFADGKVDVTANDRGRAASATKPARGSKKSATSQGDLF
ncbi:MAG: exodeoxyribonuclease VII large subunit [Beijerinckiaceae bacterium]